jgi:hypothetical protein
MTKQRIAVSADHDVVVMELGNVGVRLPYAVALQLSQWLRIRGKEAKKNAGDVRRHWSAIGILTDANETRR